MNQWSVFTNHLGLSADIYNGLYTYVRTDGSIYTENTSTFLDNGSSFYLYALTQWIKANSVQNFQRGRLIELLGDYTGASGHGVQSSFAYDWDSTLTTTPTYSFDGLKPFFQYRSFLPQQKCNAFQIAIQEIVTGASGEYIDFTDLGLEIGAKRGLNKLSSARTA